MNLDKILNISLVSWFLTILGSVIPVFQAMAFLGSMIVSGIAVYKFFDERNNKKNDLS